MFEQPATRLSRMNQIIARGITDSPGFKEVGWFIIPNTAGVRLPIIVTVS